MMKMQPVEVTVRDVTDGYTDLGDEGATGYGGRLNIRPEYQREFVYDEENQRAVIDTLLEGTPLNYMYWAVTGKGTYEIVDGQQRTISFCRYVKGDFTIKVDGYPMSFSGLPKTEQDKILNYKLTVESCSGTDDEKLRWFGKVNTRGQSLNKQEQRNAVYHGPWITAARKKFSKADCPARRIAGQYLRGTAISQSYLETALKWRSGGKIEEYMDAHRYDMDAEELWRYFQDVFSWVKRIFPERRDIMKGIDWGDLHTRYKDKLYTPVNLENEIQQLLADEDVTNKKGIYPYVLDHDANEKDLSLRGFPDSIKQAAYERQNGICPGPKCGGKHFEITEMEADHITPWSESGKTDAANCQMLCRTDNRAKGAR
jgi:uncharacterized protein DUF262/HNH endonuclease